MDGMQWMGCNGWDGQGVTVRMTVRIRVMNGIG